MTHCSTRPCLVNEVYCTYNLMLEMKHGRLNKKLSNNPQNDLPSTLTVHHVHHARSFPCCVGCSQLLPSICTFRSDQGFCGAIEASATKPETPLASSNGTRTTIPNLACSTIFLSPTTILAPVHFLASAPFHTNPYSTCCFPHALCLLVSEIL